MGVFMMGVYVLRSISNNLGSFSKKAQFCSYLANCVVYPCSLGIWHILHQSYCGMYRITTLQHQDMV